MVIPLPQMIIFVLTDIYTFGLCIVKINFPLLSTFCIFALCAHILMRFGKIKVNFASALSF